MTTGKFTSSPTNSQAYEAYMGRWSALAARAVIDCLGQAKGQRWLDVGCGTGAMTQAIVDIRDPRSVLGIDPSADQLAIARTKIASPAVRFAQGTIEQIPTGNDQLDIVVAGLVLHFIPDRKRATAEMRRVCRSRGLVTASIWDNTHPRHFNRPFWQAAQSLDPGAAQWDPSTRGAINDPKPLEQAFAHAGLRDIAVDALAIPVTFSNFEDYWRPFLMHGSSAVQQYTRTRSKVQQERLAEAVRARLSPSEDGTISLEGRVWLVRGSKPDSAERMRC